MHLYILDTGALLSQWTLKNPGLSFLTTESVIDEIKNRPSKNRIQNLISTDRLRVESPSPESIDAVMFQAHKMGDAHVLSQVDLELIAIGLYQSQLGHQVSVVSTDMAVLNTATSLGLGIVDPKGKMKRRITWVLKCPACGNEEPEGTPSLDCPTCGTTMRRKSKRRTRIN